ncbi:MAG TPA: DUF4982 domain-containing protein [Tepidisphaeraceae bacterium]|nr:DUF4982 domain-containing protein [Tepidisphaeraceae bacterium]
MKNLGRFALAAVLAFAAVAGLSRVAGADSRYDFNRDWRLIVGDPKGAAAPGFDDSGWKPVTLPRPWNEDDAFAKGIRELRTGIAWYRKHFRLPNDAAGKKVFLEFEGIRQAGEFFVNGRSVGLHENGVMACGLDVTDALNPPGQDNVIAVRTDSDWKYHERATRSGFEWSDQNFYANYGGINENVILHVADRLHQTLPLCSNLGTTGVYVYSGEIDVPSSSATVHVESQIKNDYAQARTFAFEVAIDDAEGKRLSTDTAGGPVTLGAGQTTTVSAAAKLSGLHFWSWGYGYLYTVHTSITVDGRPIDAVDTRTGFRKTDFSHGYLTLNDRPIQIHGYAQRSTNEWPALGNAVPAWVSDYSNGLMVEGGADLVRWMHVTPWKQDVESCDRVGLMEAMPAGDSEKDVEGRRWEQRVEVMRDAIIYNRNNPSIVFYESGNAQISEAHMREMKQVRDTYDPHGGRAIGCRNMLHRDTVAEYGGDMLYINKSAGKPLWAMEFCRDEASRKYWDALTPPFHKDGDGPRRSEKERPDSYNRNQDSYGLETVRRWYEYYAQRPGTGLRVNAGGVNIYFSDSNTHFRGAANYRCSGEVDAVRLPKDAYFANQVMWDGWVDPERPRIHILGHWNYVPDVTKDVAVVSSADKVKLFLDGNPLPPPTQSDRFLFTFKDVKFQAGTLKALGYDQAGKELCSAELKTAGPPAALRLTPHVDPTGLRADGADLALIDVEVLDKDQHRCPTALNTVHFTLLGPAEWRGGIAQDDNRPDNYILSKDLPVQCGTNRVLVRTTPQAGTISLRAESDGLAPASVDFASAVVPVTNGVTALRERPAPSLSRGPTPTGPSFTPTRTPLTITRVTAGSNRENAAGTIDDDETTSWSSSGTLADAWIEYELPSATTVNEVCLKLVQFRTRSYPLRITVDGHEAYRGVTPPTLGYVTLPLKPTVGNVVRVQLWGDAQSSNELDLTEVTGKKNIDADAPKPNARGSLCIIEAELFGPPRHSLQ